MGANMARRLKEKGFQVAAVYDVRREAATELARELECSAPEKLSEVTAPVRFYPHGCFRR